ncbi:hypothetical protein RUND412_001675 [Rhizina undulata]
MASESSYKPIACLMQFGSMRKPRGSTADKEMHAKSNSQLQMDPSNSQKQHPTGVKSPSPATTSHKKVRIQEAVSSMEGKRPAKVTTTVCALTPKAFMIDSDNRLRQENGSPVPKHRRRNFDSTKVLALSG